MWFAIYRGIIFSVFCKVRLSWECSGSPLFLCCLQTVTFGRMQPLPEPRVRHSTHCSRAERSLADSRAFQLTLDTECIWPHVRMWQPWQGSQVLLTLCSFYCASRMFPCWLLPFAFCWLNNGSVWPRRSNSGVLQFYHAIYSSCFGWAHCSVPYEEPQLLLLLKVKQIRRVRLCCCSPVTHDCSLCCCFPGHGAFSTSVTPPGSKSRLSMLASLCP